MPVSIWRVLRSARVVRFAFFAASPIFFSAST
jgi:hypothetical protein